MTLKLYVGVHARTRRKKNENETTETSTPLWCVYIDRVMTRPSCTPSHDDNDNGTERIAFDRWIGRPIGSVGRAGRRREGRARDTTMSRALVKLFEPWVKSASTAYRATVGAELRKYGLRYDDLLDEGQDLDVGEALKRLSQEERDMRAQRLKRAMDLSMKHTYLSAEEQAKQTPFDFYLTPVVERVKAERAERAALGAGQPYNRQIP